MERAAVCRDLRKRFGVTQEQLAAFFGVSNMTVSRWETGAQPVPHTELAVLALLADERTRPMVVQLLKDVRAL